MDGIIYLHGCTNKNYSHSEGDGLILSSSEFGRAYLSDGWATTFVKEIINRYVVVFVGYSADDPPVHYLLEALNKREGHLAGVYAFQEGKTSEATTKWNHKGVKAIAYAPDDGHLALWKTLEAWSKRATSPEEWYQSVIKCAKKGPKELQPHERGQIAHIVSTLEGVRQFSEGDSPPPAEWLCVFDPSRRYAMPRHMGGITTQGDFIDPFDYYGLDSDAEPKKIEPNDLNPKRETPPDAWNCFTPNRLDLQNLNDNCFSTIQGRLSTTAAKLPPRLNQIGSWISKVANQPATVWWANKQIGLHSDIQDQIKWQLTHSDNETTPVIRQAWRYLFEAWGVKVNEHRSDWYNLKAITDMDGWSSATIREYAAINRPYIAVEDSFSSGHIPPNEQKDIQFRDLLSLDVNYPDQHRKPDPPDKWLILFVRELRKNLELAQQLETELGGYGLGNIGPIIPDKSPGIDHHGRTSDLSGRVISFSSFFERLVKLDISNARQELAAWPVNDDTIFSLLKIWVSGNKALISPQRYGEILSSLSDKALWNYDYQRDLLISLAGRYQELTTDIQKTIENRLLEGPARWNGEEEDEYEDRRCWAVLNRITWLANNGCNFTFDLNSKTRELQKFTPKWTSNSASSAADSRQSRGGLVRTVTEHSLLMNVPLDSILTIASESTGRSKKEWSLTEKDPFKGFSTKYPVRAFSALQYAAKQDEYPEWAWRTFLYSDARTCDSPKLSALIAERISKYPITTITNLLQPIADWIHKTSEQLTSVYPSSFDKIFSTLLNALRKQPSEGRSSIIRNDTKVDWTMEAINAPVGKIAQALFNDPRKNDLESNKGFPSDWLAYVKNLLSLDGDLRRHALVIFAHNLNWFYTIDPDWTKRNLLPVLDGENEADRNAAWSGFFWGSRVPNLELYLQMKACLLKAAKEYTPSRRGHSQTLAGIILSGWGTKNEKTKERLISNIEMSDVLLHSDEDFRLHTLWQLGNWLNETQENSENEKWSDMVPELLQYVWPRQKSVKTPAISTRLCDLTFSNADHFEKLSRIVLPLLTTCDQNHLRLPNLRKSKDTIIDIYPHQTLALLYVVLPDNIASWPYDIEEVFQRISEADNDLNSDERLLELKRKWNAR